MQRIGLVGINDESDMDEAIDMLVDKILEAEGIVEEEEEPIGKGVQVGILIKAAPAKPYQPGASPYMGTQLQPSKKNPNVRRWQGQPKQPGMMQPSAMPMKPVQQPAQAPPPPQAPRPAAAPQPQPTLGVTTKPQPTMTQAKQAARPPGATLSREEAVRAIASYIQPFETTMTELKAAVGGLGKIKGRLKEPDSLIEKLSRQGKSVEQITDMAGIRLTTPDWQSLQEAIHRVKGHFKIVEEDDFVNKDHPGGMGYRSYHLLVEAHGKPVEVQLRTESQDKWAEWAHDALYKGEFKNDQKFISYARAMSDYLKAHDMGERTAQQPDCPEEIRRVEMCLDEAA